MILELELPAGINDKLSFSSLSFTVSSLKNSIEKLYGIPSEKQVLHYNKIKLNDEQTLEEIGVKNNEAYIVVGVDEGWTELVISCLQGNNTALQHQSVQHGDEVDYVLLTLLISATRGFPSSLVTILSSNNDFDLTSATNITGRTVLHAAVSSGSLKCVEEIKKHAGSRFERLLHIEDNTGCTPIACLGTNNLRMLNYINKFVSTPVSIQDIRESSERAKLGENENPEISMDYKVSVTKEDTFIIEDGKAPFKEGESSDQTKMIHDDVSMVVEQDISAIKELPPVNNKQSSLAKLTRPKTENGNHSPLPTVKQPVGNHEVKPKSSPRIFLVSPINLEKTGRATTLKVGKPITEPKNNSPKLPAINNGGTPINNGVKSPRFNGNESDLQIPSFARRPRPPTQDKKKRPVAGVLKESSARKFSAVRNTRTSSDGDVSVPRHVLAPRRPASADSEVIKIPKPDEERSPTQKVRRISLIQNPHKALHTNETTTGGENNEITHNQVVIEIDKDRMDKPWNNWIKAVTVDADSEEAKVLVNNPVVEQPKSRKVSLQVNDETKNRKISFEQWILYKTQEEVTELNKLRDENKDKEANEAELKWKHGKTFEQWIKEKEEYDRLLKEQEEEDKREDLPPRKHFKGKTFEQWQKETEEKEKTEHEVKKIQHANEKEEKEVQQQKRRKESTAKYEKWLFEKEMQELEKELKAKQTIAKRKTSTTKSLSDPKSRKRSIGIKNGRTNTY